MIKAKLINKHPTWLRLEQDKIYEGEVIGRHFYIKLDGEVKPSTGYCFRGFFEEVPAMSCSCGNQDSNLFVYVGPYAGYVYRCLECKEDQTLQHKIVRGLS